MAYKVGLDGKLYHNTGTFGSPTWTLIPSVGDVEVSDEMDEADMTNRSGGGFEQIIPTIRKLSVDLDLKYDPADTVQTALRTAYGARTIKEFAIADAAIATVGTNFLKAFCFITKFGWSQKLREGMAIPMMIKPGYDSQANPTFNTTAS